MEPADSSSLLTGVLERGDDLADRGKLLSACETEGLSNCPSPSNGMLVTYGQSTLATFLHAALLYRNKDVQRRGCHHPRRDVLLIGVRERLVGGRKSWFQHGNRDHVLLPQLGSVIGSLGPIISVLQAIFPVTTATTFPTSKTRSVSSSCSPVFIIIMMVTTTTFLNDPA